MPTFEYRKLIRADIVVKVEYNTTRKPLLKGIAFSKNLSSTGINIIIADKLAKGTELELKIYIPETAEPVFAKGQIIWQARCSYVSASKREYYSTGIQFSYMSPEHAIKASDFVKEVLKKKSEEQVREIIGKIENLKDRLKDT